MVQLENRSTTALGAAWDSFTLWVLARMSSPYSLFTAAAAAGSCAPPKTGWQEGPALWCWSFCDCPCPQRELCLLAELLGRGSKGGQSQQDGEVEGELDTACPGSTFPGHDGASRGLRLCWEGRTGLAFRLPFSLGSRTPNTFSKATSVFFPNSFLNTSTMYNSEGKIIRKQGLGLACKLLRACGRARVPTCLPACVCVCLHLPMSGKKPLWRRDILSHDS